MPPKRQREETDQGQAAAVPPPAPLNVFVCLESEGECQSQDDVSIIAVVDSEEAARLACRDNAMGKRDEYFRREWNTDLESDKKMWLECFASGSYDNSDWDIDSRYRYKVWFEGSYSVKCATDIPQHSFDTKEEVEEEEETRESADERYRAALIQEATSGMTYADACAAVGEIELEKYCTY
jgi:hypothetical protein